METKSYGTLIKRVKAVIVDSLVLALMAMIASTVLNIFENTPGTIRLIVFLFVFFIYDPFCTSFIGGTIGHLVMGLRIRNDKNEEQNIIFPVAFLRFFIKAFLGWISLLTVSGNKKHKAIHDLAANSVVIQV
ncbi:MAG: RDD family protein [Bacteroidales bacterium]|nr:RDD family protein [Bacteroidales bacterium]